MQGKLDHERIGALADAQHGVVTGRQLREMGLGKGAIEHRVRTGHLYPHFRSVFSVGRRKLTGHGRWMAAVLAYGPRAVLSHLSAAALHDLRRTNSARIDVTIVANSTAKRPGVTIHRTTSLHADETTVVDGIPVTSVARTILDLAAVLSPTRLLYAIEQAFRMNVLNLDAIELAMARRSRAAGIKTLRQLLADFREPPLTLSQMERRFYELIRRAGLPMPQCNVYVAGELVDFFWPQWNLVVELDGRPYHIAPRAFETDRKRDAKFQRAGIWVLRVTAKRLNDEPDEILDDILAFARRAA